MFCFYVEPPAQFAVFDADKRNVVPCFGVELPACHDLFGSQSAECRAAVDFLHEIARRSVQRTDASVVDYLDRCQAVGL